MICWIKVGDSSRDIGTKFRTPGGRPACVKKQNKNLSTAVSIVHVAYLLFGSAGSPSFRGMDP